MTVTDEESQKPIVDWLANLETHDDAEVRHIETHISHVFLAGDRVIKLKKAVKPDFLDYSTPDKRKAAAETELRVNSRTVPEMYLAVEPITRANGGFALGGEGEAIDWVVVMRRFDQACLLDVMAREDRLDESHIRDLADTLADLHATAERRSDHGGAEGMHSHFQWPLEALRDMADDALPVDRDALERVASALEAEWKRLAPRLEARRRHGRVRRGHGDLHLGNACLFEGKATAFDAIEFSEEIACIDVLYDAAFTVMDLLAHDRRGFANLFLSRYLEATEDTSGLAALAFFIAVRALVRTMAEAFAEKPDSARRYFALAQESLESRVAPQLVAVGGFSGTGKSSIARRLATDLAPGAGALHMRSDGLRKRLYGLRPEDPLPDEAYTREWHRRTYTRLYRTLRRALLAGYPAIADATFTRAGSREAVARCARDLGVPFTGLWLTAPADMLEARVAARGADASDADVAVLQRQLATKTGEIAWAEVSAVGSLEETYLSARQRLGL